MPANKNPITLRSLEREDLKFVHALDNNANVMRYWFEEPFVSFDELVEIYDRHTHDQNERRFIIANLDNVPVGLVELVEINYIHRHCEFQIIISPGHQGHGYAKQATRLAIDYAFMVLNLHKVYLYVDTDNARAIHIYTQIGFEPEGTLRETFFVNGQYRNAIIMGLLQRDYLALRAGTRPEVL